MFVYFGPEMNGPFLNTTSVYFKAS